MADIDIEKTPKGKLFSILSSIFGRGSISRSNITASNYQYLVDKPSWLSLSNPSQYRLAVAENPVLNGCIAILAEAASNGEKYLIDLNGKEIPWNSKKTGVDNARRLFIERPNPLQSAFEFNYERIFMFFTYGNNYVYANNPLDTFETDITNVQTLFNLPSEYVKINQTGKIYDQVSIDEIISGYALTLYNPVKVFPTKNIIHFNDINLSNIGNSVIGTSRLENLRYPITNSQLAFEAMNVILKSRGMQGIIKQSNKDAQGTQIPVAMGAKEEVDAKFKEGYGLRDNQNQFLIVHSDIEYIKTIMNSQELGIYEEFSNNAIIICNNLGVPPEMYKTHRNNATYENQVQSERRLYQGKIIPMVKNEDAYWTERLNMRKYGFELKTRWEHIASLQENIREKASSLTMNVNSANKAYTDNVITWNQYLEMIGYKPVIGGDIYKKDRDRPVDQPLVV